MSFKGIPRLWLAIPVSIVLFSSCQKGAVPSLENERMSIAFDAATGWPVSMKDKAFNEEMLDGSVPLWELRDARDSIIKEETTFVGCRRKPEGLQLRWKTASGIKVKAKASLVAEDNLIHWSISVAGLEPGSSVLYPILDFKKMENEDFAISSWLGRLEKDPRSGLSAEKPLIRFSSDSPGALSMQMIASYDRESGRGLYLASNDSLSFAKTFTIELDSAKTRFYLTHYPALGNTSKFWNPGYEVITGPFRGDWLTAAKIYRRWADRRLGTRHRTVGLEPRALGERPNGSPSSAGDIRAAGERAVALVVQLRARRRFPVLSAAKRR